MKYDSMPRYPVYLTNKEIPDEKLLNSIRYLSKDRKTIKEISEELPGISITMIRRYYMKIRRGIW